MTIILNDYGINTKTQALIPEFNIGYATRVMEANENDIYITKKSLDIIRASCLDGGASYEGRRSSVISKMGFTQKLPIPIYPESGIFACPTQSPTNYECIWIFPRHVKRILAHSPNESIIIFNDNKTLLVNESKYTLEKQMQRTAICAFVFTKGPDPIMI